MFVDELHSSVLMIKKQVIFLLCDGPSQPRPIGFIGYYIHSEPVSFNPKKVDRFAMKPFGVIVVLLQKFVRKTTVHDSEVY